jgi:hypothetical protein
MAARWMQAKRLKQKKMRASFPKRYRSDIINVGAVANPIAMQEWKARAKSVSDPWLDALFPGEKHTPPGKVDNKEALRREKIRAEAKEFAIVMEDNRRYKTTLFFSLNDGPSYFEQYDKFGETYKSSDVYDSMTNAKIAWDIKGIRWHSAPPNTG